MDVILIWKLSYSFTGQLYNSHLYFLPYSNLLCSVTFSFLFFFYSFFLFFHFIPATFQLIVMKDGRLQACGSYKDIELKQPQIIAKWNSIIAKANENAKDQQQKWVENDDVTATTRVTLSLSFSHSHSLIVNPQRKLCVFIREEAQRLVYDWSIVNGLFLCVWGRNGWNLPLQPKHAKAFLYFYFYF